MLNKEILELTPVCNSLYSPIQFQHNIPMNIWIKDGSLLFLHAFAQVKAIKLLIEDKT